MADIPATTVDAGKQLALRAAATTDTTTYKPGRCLVVNNASVANVEVKVPSLYDNDVTADDVIADVTASQTWLVPLKARYAGPDGTINLEYEATASVTVGVIDFPRAGRRILDQW